MWGLIASLQIGNAMRRILNPTRVAIWVKLLTIPRPLPYAGILLFGTLGTDGLRQSWFDPLRYPVGQLGFLMRRYDFPVTPVIVGMILGPLSGNPFRRALSIRQSDPSVFMTHPISALLLAIGSAVIVAPWRSRRMRRAGG